MAKNIDSSFRDYGIRQFDLRLIEEVCIENNIDFYWFKDHILEKYHKHKNTTLDLDPKDINRILITALNNYK